MQHSHQSTPFSKRKHHIQLICDGVSSPANMGGLLRLADAFGLEYVSFCHAEVVPDSPRLKRAARSAQKHVSFAEHSCGTNCITQLKADGYFVISLEITTNSKPIQTIELPPQRKLALVLGSEQHGISEEILRLSDAVAHIEMFGANSSMNVTQAAAIALFEFTKR